MIQTFVFALLAAQLCPAPASLSIRHTGDYGPYGGDGPSFGLTLRGHTAILTSHRWVVPDGVYSAVLSPSDAALLVCMVTDLSAVAEPGGPRVMICPHAPSFDVSMYMDRGEPFFTSECISQVKQSRLSGLYALAHRLASSYCWSPADPRVAAGV